MGDPLKFLIIFIEKIKFKQVASIKASILSTIATTLLSLSGCPCGNEANCDTLAETNKLAEAFLQAATHALTAGLDAVFE